MERVGVAGLCAVVAMLVLPPVAAAAAVPASSSSSSCTRSCGNISIPYPFGVEPGCYHAAGFNLTCRQGDPPELFLGDGTVQVLEISVPSGTVHISSRRMEFGQGPYSRGRITTWNVTWGGGLPEAGPFFLSESVNKLRVVGCNVQVDLHARLGGSYILVGSCTAICPMLSPLDRNTSVLPYPRLLNGSCGGLGCCEANIIMGYSFYNIQIQNRSIESSPSSWAPSLDNPGIFIIDQDS